MVLRPGKYGNKEAGKTEGLGRQYMRALETLCVRLGEKDTVITAVKNLQVGEYTFRGKAFVVRERIPPGFKLAIEDIAEGKKVVKYSYPIGIATQDIQTGTLVHVHNLASIETSKRKVV